MIKMMEDAVNNNFPLEIRDVEPKLAEDLMKQFTGGFFAYFVVWGELRTLPLIGCLARGG